MVKRTTKTNEKEIKAISKTKVKDMIKNKEETKNNRIAENFFIPFKKRFFLS